MYPQRPTFASVLRSFASADGLPFADVLTEQDIQKTCADENVFFGDFGSRFVKVPKPSP